MSGEKLLENELNDITRLIWGSELKEDIFNRWTQGFVLSSEEPSALVQYQGGPCAIIAPVQAFLLKNLLFDAKKQLQNIPQESCRECLIEALVELQSQASPDTALIHVCEDVNSPTTSDGPSIDSQDGGSSPKRRKFSHQIFNNNLRYQKCSTLPELRTELKNHINQYCGEHGVLLFLYSMVLTKGMREIKEELEDTNDSLIDTTHGHGSQSLINLLLCGKAVSNVFDNDKDISGMKLLGIPTRGVVGFLSILEQLRYCEVGWYLKNPQYPIWVLASETHLTVFFSQDESCVTMETEASRMRQIFSSYDPESNGFISSAILDDVMNSCSLVSEPEYVEIMKTKLDPESLGVIVQSAFMEEFFPEQEKTGIQSFHVFHHNGIERSCNGAKVKYFEGVATVPDMADVMLVPDVNPILRCLQTKWPTIELEWNGHIVPSLN